MEEELLIGLPADITAAATVTYEFPKNRRYLIQNTPPELTQWPGGSMYRQMLKGDNFVAEVFIVDVKKSFVADLWIKSPNALFFYTLKGYFTYRNNGNALQILQGESAIFQTQQGHFKMHMLPGYHVYFFFYLDNRMLTKLIGEFEGLQALSVPSTDNELITSPIRGISEPAEGILFRLRQIRSQGQIAEHQMEGILLELASSVRTSLHVDQKSRGKTTKDIVIEIREFIGSEINRGAVPTVGDIAEAFHLTPRRLGEVFHDLFGLPLRDYLNEKRMEVSYRLLSEEKITVSDVANYLGYQDPSNFSRRFKNYFGFPPSEAYSRANKKM